MTPKSDLEIEGSFFAHPFAEVLAEIAHAQLDGSLRVSNKEKKCVVYFKGGRVVFAVSNSRSSRLFDVLLRRNKFTKEALAKAPNFVNDFELVAFLQDANLVTQDDCDRLFVEQIEGILVDVLGWPEGDWAFSSLTRVRDGLSYQVDVTKLLVDYGRCMPVDSMLRRFRSLDESFRRSELPVIDVALKTEEAFVLSRADQAPLSAASLTTVAAMPEEDALHSIYTLWLSGLLIRDDWQPALSPEVVMAMRYARLELKKEASLPIFSVSRAEKKRAAPLPAKPKEAKPKAADVQITVEEYLERVENSQTHYDILGVDPKVEIAEIKKVYFSLARMFHPDRYHAQGGDLLRRVQKAFTELAQAHETLKAEDTRELYDYRMRKEIGEREDAGRPGNVSLQAQQAEQSFDHGFNLLMDGEAEAALPFLARAVHYAPKTARYRAYYGKALSSDDKQRHKAESEMQAALKLDANNPTFRLLLAEFFIQFKLKKRAEGELTRLLALFPSHREALDLLAKLRSS